MKTIRRLLAVGAVVALSLLITAQVASAQVQVDPSTTPVKNTGAWVSGITLGLIGLGLLVAVLIVVGYMRYAPRFASDEESFKVVQADRVLPGREAPRRAVDLSQAAPVVVPPPALPVGANAPAVGPGSAAPATATAAAAAPATAAPAAAAAPAAPAPAAAAASAAASAAAPAPAAAPATPAPAAAAVPEERPEVSLDQEVFEKTLQELLDAGTDRRIAEGKARRAAMIAARKKAAGEG